MFWRLTLITDIMAALICRTCAKGFASRSGLNRHIRTIHKFRELHACEDCGKTFGRKDNLSQHCTRLGHSPIQGKGQLKFSPLKEAFVMKKWKHSFESVPSRYPLFKRPKFVIKLADELKMERLILHTKERLNRHELNLPNIKCMLISNLNRLKVIRQN